MLFNSFEFLLFLPIVFTLYWFVFNKSLRWQNGLVLIASYFFYGWWSWKFMGLLILSALFNHTCGFSLVWTNKKIVKIFFLLCVFSNLGIKMLFISLRT
jgi:D-alanyl-lipoteichoic acid acyltransferase DltB (MBOAT superfamily)